MSLLSKLFGSSTPKEAEAVTYEGFRITPEPVKEGTQFRLGAKIEKEVDGELKTHSLIRADTFGSEDQAVEMAVVKSKQLIDQMGDKLF
ncbi:HlyU family transcriptional regulator [Alterinioella nitratireducens]|uniref:HlyU family transcriptional regulator n=1 Tax=Alterinioella nitratireducens TaxID=2735915 RepID=UPI000C576C3A|nr:hypothetical protein [Nioella sp.]